MLTFEDLKIVKDISPDSSRCKPQDKIISHP